MNRFFEKLFRLKPRFASTFVDSAVFVYEHGNRFFRKFNEENPRAAFRFFGTLSSFVSHGHTFSSAHFLNGTVTCKPLQDVKVIANDGSKEIKAELALMYDASWALEGRWYGYIYLPGERISAVNQLTLDILDREQHAELLKRELTDDQVF